MKLLIFVMKKINKLDPLLAEFAHRDICGATVIDGVGMATLLYNKHDEDEIPFLGLLRSLATPEREKCKIILAAIADDEVDEAVETIEEVVGDLSNENTGVLFTVPLDYTKGICQIGK